LAYNLLQGLISDAVLFLQRIFALIVPRRTKLAPELSQKNQVIIKGFFPFLSLTQKSRKNDANRNQERMMLLSLVCSQILIVGKTDNYPKF